MAGETQSIPPGGRGGPSPLAIFGGLLVLILVSIGSSALLLTGAGRTPSAEPSPTPTQAAAQATEGTAVTSADRVRVVSSRASAAPADGGMFRVTFSWTLEGARENDRAVIRVYAGNQLLGEQPGSLDPGLFSFSTGTFTVTALLECSTAGWTAELVTVRDLPIQGDGDAVAAPVTCP